VAKFKTSKTTKKTVKAKPKKLPSNSRKIPERLNSDEVIFLVGTVAVMLAIFVVSLDLYTTFEKQKSLASEKAKIVSEVHFWESQLRDKPNYRDGYFSLALLNYRLKDMEKSRENLNKALDLDPNFKEGRELEKILDSF
jgi:tetratricopeptide (TPR) repeat protein